MLHCAYIVGCVCGLPCRQSSSNTVFETVRAVYRLQNATEGRAVEVGLAPAALALYGRYCHHVLTYLDMHEHFLTASQDNLSGIFATT